MNSTAYNSIGPDTRLLQAERVAARVIEGAAVVVVIDAQKLHTLNETGTFMWERADGRTLAEIADAMVQEFDIDSSTALKDGMLFAQQLVECGALHALSNTKNALSNAKTESSSGAGPSPENGKPSNMNTSNHKESNS